MFSTTRWWINVAHIYSLSFVLLRKFFIVCISLVNCNTLIVFISLRPPRAAAIFLICRLHSRSVDKISLIALPFHPIIEPVSEL